PSFPTRRSSDLNLFPTQIEEVLADVDKIVPNYQIHVDRKNSLDSICVKCEVKQGVSVEDKLLIKQLQSQIRAKIGIACDVELTELFSMPESQGGKTQRIFDVRKI